MTPITSNEVMTPITSNEEARNNMFKVHYEDILKSEHNTLEVPVKGTSSLDEVPTLDEL